ncbi:MAG: DUF4058 family protein [Armatimonadota bacterium]
MPSPFPGMDPYLEQGSGRHSFHTRLVTGIADAIEPLLPPGYYVSVEERTYIALPDGAELQRIPDVVVVSPTPPGAEAGSGVGVLPRSYEVLVPAPDRLRERYLEIRELGGSEPVVTVLEVLSPTNKRPGPCRDDYLEKRGAVLASRSHRVEVDLLRQGPRMPALGTPEGWDYSILVSRAERRPAAELVPFSVREPFPPLPIPLHPGQPEPRVDLGAVFTQVYDRGRYAARVDYSRPPDPVLESEDAAWAAGLLAEVRMPGLDQ